MNFDFSEEQKLLQKTARDYLVEHCPLATARAVLESGGTHDATLWKGVAEMGWLGAAVPEEYGGAGFGPLELALLAQELGRALAPIPFGPSVYLVTEALLVAGSDAQKKRYLPRLASGELIGTFAFAERAGPRAAGAARRRASNPVALHGAEVAGAGRQRRGPAARGRAGGRTHGAGAGRDRERPGRVRAAGLARSVAPAGAGALRRRPRRAARRVRRRRDVARASARSRRRADRLRADRRRRARARGHARVHARALRVRASGRRRSRR